MPRAYSGDMRQRVIAEVESGASRREAAEEFEVSASTAIIWVKCFRETDSIEAEHARVPPYRRVDGSSNPLSNDTSETQMACRRVHILRMTRRRAVSPAVVWRAQMRTALDDLARYFCSWPARIIAVLLACTARVLRNAAGLGRVGFVL